MTGRPEGRPEHCGPVLLLVSSFFAAFAVAVAVVDVTVLPV